MTELACLDGPATAAVSDRLVVGEGYPATGMSAELSTGPSLFTGPSLSTGATRCDWARRQRWRFSRMPAAPWPPPTHMVTMP